MSEDATHERTLLLVDTDIDYLNWATKHLEADGIRILRVDNSDNALKVFEKASVDIVIADIAITPDDGISLLGQIKANHPDTVVIITAGFPGTAQIIKATQQGAHDILRKESLTFELRSVVENAWQVVESRRSFGEHKQTMPDSTGRIQVIGVSRVFQDVFKTVGRVARTDAPVFIFGESGTGKELVANAVHEYSSRRKNEMVALNCGAIPDNLLESELFGHEKGSFTGAAAKRMGRFEQCDGGTLFLDEIGDMPLPVQVKLLRVLQEGTFSRVGGNEVLTSDVRIVAATNKDLAQEVREGRFREDLYYRLNVVELRLPPLRERIEDIPLLAEFFLRKITKKNGMVRLRLSGEAISVLQQHKWPGNVRELENTMARATALATSDVLLADDIPIGEALLTNDPLTELLSQALKLAKSDARLKLMRTLVFEALELSEGSQEAAAKLLGVAELPKPS
ncbi:sigma-54-dependent transcriptional regulator [Rubritalea marina]|uniref:sigma-54-dependent transcriptional regulator n=1 Tax=Rubritalea marina TaxID=361055 RepID=UPI00037C65B2|nr:sigma-54 dependent transcriptional regulator [Rubritalea marina]